MKDAAPQPVHLSDYRPPAFLIDRVDLTFRLAPRGTRVLSRIAFRPNPEATDRRFHLDGEGLRLVSAAIDGQAVDPVLTPDGLTCEVPDAPFLWEADVEIAPEANTALEGLYMSGGIYCSQCEAEGFRRITYYPDRPDVMAVFTVRIESDAPVLLSNGNLQGSGDGWAEWHDPWPKPAYLFGLVAGDLTAHRDRFATRSGREVDLAIWVRPGDEHRCAFAMEALKSAMRWDEETYGREYDLDVFNIVAVDDFNAGAMENKGLNIFNSALVLASPETATDRDYERIEGVIAHEYFHNWTGNRITCRDWFQLCLKEGLTVYRDQQFSGDMRSHAVKRIEDAILLRSRQFREDNGPLAHPVRPESFIEINNFYTVTVYEKGAELIGILRRLVGDEGYYKALDLYFERLDGQAATIEDWLAVFEEATGRDLSQFKRWYSQAGTPRITVEEEFAEGTYTLHLSQHTPATPGQPDKAPQVIPVAVGLISPNGDEVVPTQVLELTEERQSFTFEGLGAKPVPSILRGFSAPVIVERECDNEERAFLLAHDSDPFNRWDAGRALARDLLCRMVSDDATPEGAYFEGLRAVLRDESQDAAFRALVLALPSEEDIAQTLHGGGMTPDPTAVHNARERLMRLTAEALEETLRETYAACDLSGPYSPDAESAGKRSLANACLDLLSRIDGGELAAAQFDRARDMTRTLAALGGLLSAGRGEKALALFEERWSDDKLVMDKWFSLQVLKAAPEKAARVATRLTEHPGFNWRNPNRFRAVVGALPGNLAGFHAPSGEGYRFLADWLIRLDPENPQTAARLSSAFETWRRYDADRQQLVEAELRRIEGTPGLSRDTHEMVTRILAG